MHVYLPHFVLISPSLLVLLAVFFVLLCLFFVSVHQSVRVYLCVCYGILSPHPTSNQSSRPIASGCAVNLFIAVMSLENNQQKQEV